MSLRTAIEAYTAANEAFLQRKPGSVNPGERMQKVFRAFLKDVVGIPLPPFFDTFREIVRQLTEKQLKSDIAAITEETGERLYSLRRMQKIVGAYADFADYMRETGRKAAIESLDNAAHAMAKARPYSTKKSLLRLRLEQSSHRKSQSSCGVSRYNGLAIHQWVLNRYENLLLYSSFHRVTNQSI